MKITEEIMIGVNFVLNSNDFKCVLSTSNHMCMVTNEKDILMRMSFTAFNSPSTRQLQSTNLVSFLIHLSVLTNK